MMGAFSSLLLSCVTAWLYAYGTLLLFFNLWPFFSITISTSAPFFLFLAVWWMRIPPPDAGIVNEIFGPDPFNGPVEKGKFFMRSVAHRGAPLDAPENSTEAFSLCAKKGCTAVEFDLSLTKDGIPIVFHDATVDRLTGQAGVVSDMTWDELRTLDIAATHHLRDRFQNSHIALLEEVIALCLDLDLRMFIDCKDSDSKVINVILDMYKKFPKLYRRAVISGFNPLLIYMVRKADPHITCSLAFRPYWFTANMYSGEGGPVQTSPQTFGLPILLSICDKINVWMLANFTFYFLGLSAILLHSDIVSIEDLRLWRERNLRVIAWSVNKPTEKKYFSKILKVTYMTDTMIGEPGQGNEEVEQ